MVHAAPYTSRCDAVTTIETWTSSTATKPARQTPPMPWRTRCDAEGSDLCELGEGITMIGPKGGNRRVRSRTGGAAVGLAPRHSRCGFTRAGACAGSMSPRWRGAYRGLSRAGEFSGCASADRHTHSLVRVAERTHGGVFCDGKEIRRLS